MQILFDLYQQGLNNREMAVQSGLSYSTVCRFMNQHNLKTNYHHIASGEAVQRLHSEGLSNAAIARHMGINETRVGIVVRQLGFVPNCNGRLKMVGDLGQCSKCEKTYPLSKFTYKKSSAIRTVCNNCQYQRRSQRLKGDPIKQMMYKASRCKSAAKKANTPYDIDAQYMMDLWQKQTGKCFYSDIDMELSFGKTADVASHNGLSVDRVIPSLGYVRGNIVLCCTKLNCVKNNLTLAEVESYLPYWYKRIKECEWLTLVNHSHSENPPTVV